MQETNLPERVKGFVGKIFGAAEAAQAASGQPLTRPRAAAGNAVTPEGYGSREDFLRKLTDVLQQHKAAAVGRVHLFDLEKIKEKLGGRWEDHRARVLDLSQKVLGRHLQGGDVYCPVAGDSFVVVFAASSPEHAQVLLMKVALEIEQQLFGEVDKPVAAIQVTCTSVDDDAVFAQESMESVFERIGVLLDATLPAARPVAKANVNPLMEKRGQRESVDLLIDRHLPETIVTEEDIRFLYTPYWDVKAEALSIWQCAAVLKEGSLPDIVGYDVLGRNPDSEDIAWLDSLRLVSACGTLVEMLAKNFTVFVSANIHFETLANRRNLATLIKILDRLPGHAHKFLVLSIAGAPAGVPQSRIADFVNLLRPRCRAVLLQTELGTTEVATYSGVGLHGLSLRVPPDSCYDTRFEAKLAGLSAECRKARLILAVNGLNSESLARSAVNGGARYIAGAVVGGRVAKPRNVSRYTLDEVLTAAA
ncbi:hypothetical protein [Oceanibaculum nanhaiense]|uniref:hypothetical protein n=1 Tax=Oceanibaculum nanhaiense TaxID=1909734 RepID=UPI00396E7FCB